MFSFFISYLQFTFLKNLMYTTASHFVLTKPISSSYLLDNIIDIRCIKRFAEILNLGNFTLWDIDENIIDLEDVIEIRLAKVANWI